MTFITDFCSLSFIVNDIRLLRRLKSFGGFRIMIKKLEQVIIIDVIQTQMDEIYELAHGRNQKNIIQFYYLRSGQLLC